MAGARSRIASLRTWAAPLVAVAVSGLIVAQSSYAAFSKTTSNPANNWAAGSVILSDDDTNTAMFTATLLMPGSTGTKCIVVTSAGSLASTVKLYATSYADSTDSVTPFAKFGTHLNMVIDEGTGGTFATSGPTSCTGFTSSVNLFTGTLAAFAATKTNFASGVSSWAPAAGTVSKTFRFQYTLDTASPIGSQSGTASIGFTWEAQNT